MENRKLHYRKSVIFQYDLEGHYIRSYNSCVEAGKKNYLYPRVIEKCCRGELNYAGDFLWRRMPINSPPEDIEKYEPPNEKKYKPIPVSKIDDNDQVIKVYNSIKEASRDNHIDPKSIRDVLKGIQKHAGGYKWKIYSK